MKKMYVIFISVLLLSVCFAQDGTKAHELVEHVRQMMTPKGIDTVEIKITRTHFANNESDQIEQFYDLRKQRVITFVYDGKGQRLSESIFENNHMRARIVVSGELTEQDIKEMSPESVQIVTEYLAQLKEFRVFIPQSYEILSYDGLVNYGNGIEGEQVSLAYNDARKNNAYTVTRWVISDSGELVASIFPGSSTFIATHEVFTFKSYVRIKTKVFIIEEGTAYPFSELREEYYYNRDIVETQFANYSLE